MPDILLIQPPIRDFYLTAKRTIPYGLACIASTLRLEGFSVGILDALANPKSHRIAWPQEMSYLLDFYTAPDISPISIFQEFKHFGLEFDRIGEISANSGAFLIGISSLFTAYSNEAILTAESVRRHCPEAVIVMGGHHPTELPEDVLKNSCVDFVIRGEGELSLPMLAKCLREGRAPHKVPGVAFRKHGGGMHINPPAIVADLDDMPPAALDLIDAKFYQRRKSPCAVAVASRGCPMKCSYCSIGCASWLPFRLKSISQVMEHLEHAVFVAGTRFIDFEDENISFDRGWFISLLGAIRKKFAGLGVELRAMNGLFPPTLDDEVIGEMKAAGFTALNLSLCTTSPEQLKLFRRADVRTSFESALDSAQKHGLDCIGYIIAGAPGQSAQDSIADLLYLAGKKVLAGVSVFYPSPGSADFELCRERFLLPGHYGLMRSTALPICDTTTREDSATLLRLGRVLNFIKSLSPRELSEVRAASNLDQSEITRHIKEICTRTVPDQESRRTAGKLIVALFMKDAKIRGITRLGDVFNQRVSIDLCTSFRNGVSRLFDKPPTHDDKRDRENNDC